MPQHPPEDAGTCFLEGKASLLGSGQGGRAGCAIPAGRRQRSGTAELPARKRHLLNPSADTEGVPDPRGWNIRTSGPPSLQSRRRSPGGAGSVDTAATPCTLGWHSRGLAEGESSLSAGTAGSPSPAECATALPGSTRTPCPDRSIYRRRATDTGQGGVPQPARPAAGVGCVPPGLAGCCARPPPRHPRRQARAGSLCRCCSQSSGAATGPWLHGQSRERWGISWCHRALAAAWGSGPCEPERHSPGKRPSRS